MKTCPRLGMRPLAWAVRDWRRAQEAPRPLALAVSYPHYLYLRDLVRPDALVAVRHSRRRDEPPLLFSRDEWKAFVAGVQNHEFDLD
jgi:hypothetical protein